MTGLNRNPANNHNKVKTLSNSPAILILHRDGSIKNMSYSTMARALISYIENHLENFDIREMSESFGFSEIYLRELFLKNINIPIMKDGWSHLLSKYCIQTKK